MIPEKIPEEKIRRILDLRAEGSTQEEIAEAVEVSRSTVARYLGKQKKKLGPKLNRFLTVPELQGLCEVITPIILEKLKQANPDGSPDEGEDKEKNRKEEEMADGDVESKAQEIADRREMLKRLEKIDQLSKDMEVLKSQTGRAPEELAQQIGELKEGIDSIKNQTANFCKLYPDLCKRTEDAVAKKVEALQPKGILGTDLTLKEFHADRDSQKVLASKYLSDSGLLAALERCTDPQCKVLRQEALKRGIKIQKKTKDPGMLGPEWEDIE